MNEPATIHTPSVNTVRPLLSGSRIALFYVGTVVISILLFLLIRQVGSELPALPASAASVSRAAPSSPPNMLEHLLLALTAIVIASRLTGAFFQRFHQPPVIGEVLAGIMLGPSLLGRVAPEAMGTLFPPFVVPALTAIAQVGVVLFMLLVGLELNTASLRQRSQAMLAISHVSILCPFLLGSLLALYLYPRFSTAAIPFTAFALFIGVSLSITAFPVLARILTDRRLHRTSLGIIALTCAAVNDVTAWCLLAFVVGVVQSQLGGAVLTTLLTLIYIAFMLFITRPLLMRFVEKVEAREDSDPQIMGVMSVSLLLSCLAAESIGIHAIFGAFLLGALVPHESRVARTLTEKLHDFVVIMLLPAFFALTGLRTQISLITGAAWVACLLIIAVAFVGKFGGATLAARFTGLGWRDSAALGILMNTRGLVELIVLNVGLDLKVISPQLFAMFVLMALVTTFATSPILDRLLALDWTRENKERPAPGE